MISLVVKTCIKCKQQLSVDLFYKCKQWADGYQQVCKSCERIRFKEYYRLNKYKFLQSSKEITKRKKEFINSLKNSPCVDCGKSFPPICMDFDHTNNDKVLAVSTLLHKGKPMKDILEEVKKCELVCSNCHRLRTWKRMLI